MLKNNKYFYKGFDIFDINFGDERNFGGLNPYGYNWESSSRREIDFDEKALKSSTPSGKNMLNNLKR